MSCSPFCATQLPSSRSDSNIHHCDGEWIGLVRDSDAARLTEELRTALLGQLSEIEYTAGRHKVSAPC